ncbi:MAG: acyltransferase [Bacillota bacterium]|nr:acyltransferase [Bacillota bacterium]
MHNKINEKYDSCFDLGWISKYRNELFGIAIVAIMLFHYSVDFNSAIEKGRIGMEPFLLKSCIILDYYKWISSIGVEIFVFLSGMGLYYSFYNNNNIGTFYKKRYKRILVPYLIVASVFWAFKDFKFQGEGLKEYLQDISFVTFFTDGVHTIWFIALMIVLYLLFPVIYKLLDREKNRTAVLIILLVLAYGMPIVLFYSNQMMYDRISIAVTRIPLFILGCYFGKYIKSGYRVPYSHILIFAVIAIFIKYCRLCLDFEPYMSRYLDGIFALGLLIMLTSAIEICKNFNALNRLWRFFGKYSLELYMVHVSMRNLMKEFGYDAYRISQYFGMIVLAIVVSVLLNKFCSLINRILNRIC